MADNLLRSISKDRCIPPIEVAIRTFDGGRKSGTRSQLMTGVDHCFLFVY